jgi:hypothetical protein
MMHEDAAARLRDILACVGMVLPVDVTANFYDSDRTTGDPFGATSAVRFVAYLTIGYMIARGIAMSGGRVR